MKHFLIPVALLLPALAAGQAPQGGENPTNYNMFMGSIVSGENYTPLTGEQRWRLYLRQAYGNPGAAFRALGPAIGDHSDNDPPEWGQGMKGYSRRALNRFGRFTLRDSIEHTGAAALGHEVRYVRCKCEGFFPRVGHALAMNALTYNREGRWRPHVSRLGGMFAAEYIGNAWMPAGSRTSAEALRGVALQVGMGSLFNIVKEFSPEVRRALRRR